MSSTRPVLLVHGAWHGAWCWSATQAELDRLGVPSWAVDLPGHGLSADPVGNLEMDAEHVRQAMTRIGEDIVLVGHSYGGAVITAAAARHLDDGGSVAHLVYVAAFPLEDGESVWGLVGALPPGDDSALRDAMQMHDDGTITIGPLERATEAFYGRCDAAAAAAAYARLSPQARASFSEPLSGDPRASVPSTYVICSQDRALPPHHQRILAARCGAQVELATDHSPFLSMPLETAAAVAGISRR